MNIINNINQIYTLNSKDLKLIFKLNIYNFNNFLTALNNNNSINLIIIDQLILNNDKFISLIDILKNKHNLHKITIELNRKTDLKYINEIYKLNNVKINLIINIKGIIDIKNLTEFILNTNIHKYELYASNKKDIQFLTSKSNINVFNITYHGYMIDDFFKYLIENNNIKELKYKEYANKSYIGHDTYNMTNYINNTSINKLKLSQSDFYRYYYNYKAFINSLKNNTSIKHLTLKNCEYIRDLEDALKNNKGIKTLEIYNDNSGNNDWYYLNVAYKYSLTMNKVLEALQDNDTLENLYIDYDIIKSIRRGDHYVDDNTTFNNFFLKNKTLKRIVILDCFITNIDGLIEGIKNNDNLEYLHLLFNNKLDKLNELNEVLKSKKNIKFYKIDIDTKNEGREFVWA